jgi:hypothetical protein
MLLVFCVEASHTRRASCSGGPPTLVKMCRHAGVQKEEEIFYQSYDKVPETIGDHFATSHRKN